MNTTTASIPQEDRPEEPKKALRLANQPAGTGDTIRKLAINRWYVPEETNLLDLADDLNNYPNIPAVGVTDSNGRLLGQIIRQDLLDLLGRPFGRDILLKENVVRVAQNSKTFRQTETIMAVCEQIGLDNLAAQQGYFPVKSDTGEYAGIFSTQDLLVYLSAASRPDKADFAPVQHRLVKDLQIFESPEYDILSSTFRSQNANGDFGYIRQYDKDGWAIGLSASQADNQNGNLLATMLWGVVNAFDFHKGIMQFVRQLNALVLRSFNHLPGLQGFFMDFQSASGGLTLCDHGNGWGYIYRQGQVLKMRTSESAVPLGQKSELSTEIFRYQLKAGDLVILMNKSLVGQTNSNGKEYGPTRLKPILDANSNSGIRNLRNLIQADFRNFRGMGTQTRDATLVLIHFKQAKAS